MSSIGNDLHLPYYKIYYKIFSKIEKVDFFDTGATNYSIYRQIDIDIYICFILNTW